MPGGAKDCTWGSPSLHTAHHETFVHYFTKTRQAQRSKEAPAPAPQNRITASGSMIKHTVLYQNVAFVSVVWTPSLYINMVCGTILLG
mmetsp:Transcript_37102/g.55484  ORF Transcript_37102/g.55484 Transcript_37102/m.55484 type:complete len:88 (+) Transcript_37102:1-264(+)